MTPDQKGKLGFQIGALLVKEIEKRKAKGDGPGQVAGDLLEVIGVAFASATAFTGIAPETDKDIKKIARLAGEGFAASAEIVYRAAALANKGENA